MNHVGTINLETDRLLLRRFSIADSEEIFEGFRNQPEFLFYANKQKVTLEEQKKSLENIDEKYKNKSYYNWLITLKDGSKIIGAINLKVTDEEDKVVFSYAIDNRFTGKGYMTEALNVVQDFCFNTLQLTRFEGGCAVENIASKRVMEKCGLKFESVLKNHLNLSDGPHDMLVFAKTKEN